MWPFVDGKLTRHFCNITSVFRLAMVSARRSQDDQQSDEHVPSESSCRMSGQLYGVTDVWLLQLPPQWQHVRAQHTRHSTRRQLGRHRRQQCLGLVEHRLHSSPIRSQWIYHAWMMIFETSLQCNLFPCASVKLYFYFNAEWKHFATHGVAFSRTLNLKDN